MKQNDWNNPVHSRPFKEKQVYFGMKPYSHMERINNITRKHFQESNQFSDVGSHLEQLNNITRKYFQKSNEFIEFVTTLTGYIIG